MTKQPPNHPDNPDSPDLAAMMGGGKSGVAPSQIDDGDGDFGIRIARDGTWFYQGSPIGRKPLVKLFASVLTRDGAGDYWLETPVERGRIAVDDAPFTAVEVTALGSGQDMELTFRTNLDDEVVAGPDHPIRVEEDLATREPSPYVLVRDELDALIARPVFYELVEMAAESRDGGELVLGIWSRGEFFRLGAPE